MKITTLVQHLTMGNCFGKSDDLSSVKFSVDLQTTIERQIEREPVLIYSKDNCPHCISAKKLLFDKNVPHTVREINLEKNSIKKQAILFQITNQKTLPIIFIAGTHIGGAQELRDMAKSGQLRALLDDAGVPNDFY